MHRKKAKITFNLFFMLLGLTLVFIMLYEGLHSNHNWFSLIIGSLVAIDCFRKLIRIYKGENRTKVTKSK